MGLRRDITCSYPCNGIFTEMLKGIYNVVFKSSRVVMAAVKPGECGWGLLRGWGGIEKGYYLFLSVQWDIHRDAKGHLQCCVSIKQSCDGSCQTW